MVVIPSLVSDLVKSVWSVPSIYIGVLGVAQKIDPQCPIQFWDAFGGKSIYFAARASIFCEKL